MPQMLTDGAVEYEDGTPATEAQVGCSLHLLLSADEALSLSISLGLVLRPLFPYLFYFFFFVLVG